MKDETATCRGCGKSLMGTPYHFGGDAYDPVTDERCKFNFYGGYVCSRECDVSSSRQLENSMPGHLDDNFSRLSTFASRSIASNWGL